MLEKTLQILEERERVSENATQMDGERLWTRIFSLRSRWRNYSCDKTTPWNLEIGVQKGLDVLF